MKICITYVPFPTHEAAADIIRLCLHQKIIACGNIIPSQSSYLWNGDFHKENEWIAVMKTTTHHKDNLAKFLEKHHSYELPAILQWEVKANEGYAKWVENETS